jgi:modified peptide precursor CbpA
MKTSKDDKSNDQQVPARPDVIAIRKTCDAEGTGLSHYVLMDKQVKQ